MNSKFTFYLLMENLLFYSLFIDFLLFPNFNKYFVNLYLNQVYPYY